MEDSGKTMSDAIFSLFVVIIIIVVALIFLMAPWIPKAFYSFFTLIYKLVNPESGPAKIATAFVSIMFGFLIIWLAGGFLGLFTPIWSNLLGFFLVVVAMVSALCLTVLAKGYSRKGPPTKGYFYANKEHREHMIREQLEKEKARLRQMKLDGKMPEDYSGGAYFCLNCKKEYRIDEWEMSVMCKECEAWFCTSMECVTFLSNTGKCPVCGHSFSSEQMKDLARLPHN
jgi:hypothetical protein